MPIASLRFVAVGNRILAMAHGWVHLVGALLCALSFVSFISVVWRRDIKSEVTKWARRDIESVIAVSAFYGPNNQLLSHISGILLAKHCGVRYTMLLLGIIGPCGVNRWFTSATFSVMCLFSSPQVLTERTAVL